MKVLRLVSFILLLSMLLASCGDPMYNFIFGDDVQIEDGSELTDGTDPFGDKGLYEDPEVEIDGVREAEYDYPMGSGKYLVYSSETETTYVSIYKGERGIYFLFECEDDSLSALNVEDINLVTAQSDSIELYVDAYGTGGTKRGNNQHEFRVTASGRIYSYLTGFVARVFTYGTLNYHNDVDKGFNVEGYISYAVLGEGVDKNTPTSFAFARVTKTGNKGFVWHGDVDPQIPNNYLVLSTDNKFYKLDECPTNASISGRLVDLNGDPIIGAKVTAEGYKTVYTSKDGSYLFDIDNCAGDLSISYTKRDYLDYSVTIKNSDIRAARGSEIALGDTVFLSESEANYTTTLTGILTERDGKTPIPNALVEVAGNTTRTDANGAYTLEANLQGYTGNVKFSASGHIDYLKPVGITDVAINGTTKLSTTNLDESAGDSIDFGIDLFDTGTARVVRGKDSFKIVLKTESVMDIAKMPNSNFEVFVDAKGSCSMHNRDESDYLFVFQYADEGILSAKRYGAGSVDTKSIKTTYGRINELYYVEVDIPYSVIGVSSDEVFGLYFGIKCNDMWTGMYDHKGDYIPAEATINYYRLGADSKIFAGSCNVEPATDLTFKPIGGIGDYVGFPQTVAYDVSYAKASTYVMLKFDLVDNGISMTEQGHSINVYFDMNCNRNKIKKDASNYHITIYPGRAVSVYTGWDTKTGKESTVKHYESDSEEVWAYLYGDSIYVKLDTAIFGGNSSNNIGFGVAMWHDAAKENSMLSMDRNPCGIDSPSDFFIVDTSGNITIPTNWYRNEEVELDYAYSFAVVGDTQYLTQKYPDKLATIYDWIIANKDTKKIAQVIGLGDITEEWGNSKSEAEWILAQKQISKLDGVLPYSLIRGNHDESEYFLKYFANETYMSQFDGFMEEGDIRNSYKIFRAGTVDYMLVTLDYGPTDEALEWAAKLIASHPNHKVIITTHEYLYKDGQRVNGTNSSVPDDASDVDKSPNRSYNSGEQMWQKLVSKYENIVLVLSGHVISSDIVVLQSVGDHGNVVTQMLIDPQGLDDNLGGVGMMCMLYFSEDGTKMEVEWYSTVDDLYYKEKNQFTLDLTKIK